MGFRVGRVGWALALSLALSGLGCGQILGLGDFEDAPGGSTTNSSTGGDPGCTPDTSRPCYDGPEGTVDVGVCKAGQQACLPDGSGWGSCEGQTTPAEEDCGVSTDEDCNGTIDEGCQCEPGVSVSCYSGAAGTEGVGLCTSGLQTCQPDGMGYGACQGEVVPVTEDCQVVGDEDCDGVGCSDPIWSTVYSATDISTTVTAFDVDPAGNTYLLVATGGGSLDLMNGTLITAPGSLVKVDASGAFQWSIDLPSPATSLSVDAQGDVFVVGSFIGQLTVFGTTLSSQGSTDTWIARLTPNGTAVWVKNIGSNGASVAPRALALGPNYVYLVGYFGGVLSLPGQPTSTATGGNDAYCIKMLKSIGSVAWIQTFGDVSGQSPSAQIAQNVVVDAAENPTVSGAFGISISFSTGPLLAAGSADGFVAKLGANGASLWGRRIGSVVDDNIFDIAATPAGGVIVAGTLGAPADLGGGVMLTQGIDMFVAEYDALGSYVWARVWGGSGSDAASAVDVDDLGGIVVAGFFTSGTDFGFGPLEPMPGTSENPFLLSLSPTGTPRWAKAFLTGDLGADVGVQSVPVTNDIRFGFRAPAPVDVGLGVLDPGPAGGWVLARFNP